MDSPKLFWEIPAALPEMLKALSNPNRLRIFNMLMEGETCNCEMVDTLNMAPNLISHHLNTLRDVGLIQSRRYETDARWIYYSVNTKQVELLADLLAALLDSSRTQPRDIVCGPQAVQLKKNK